MTDDRTGFAELRARAGKLANSTSPPAGAAHVRYDGSTDTATVRFGVADRRQAYEPQPDVTLSFDADVLGRLVGLRVAAPVFARRQRWQELIADYTGPTVWQSIVARAQGADEPEEVWVGEEQLAALRATVWRQAHTLACDLAGRRPPSAESDDTPTLGKRFVEFLRGVPVGLRTPLSPAYAMRDSDDPAAPGDRGADADDLLTSAPGRRATLPPELAAACGLERHYRVHRRGDGGLTLRLSVADGDKAAQLSVWIVTDDIRDLTLVAEGSQLVGEIEPIGNIGREHYPLLRFVPHSDTREARR